MARAVVYSKSECPLCDKAKNALRLLAKSYPLAIEEIDITRDPDLYRRYHDSIPVVVVDEKIQWIGRIDTPALRRYLESCDSDR